MAASWVEEFHESLQVGRLITASIIGSLLAYAGGGVLYTKLRPEIMGTRASAVLLERYIGCTLVRVKGQARTEHPMPCPEAEMMQVAEQSAGVSGSDKIGIRRDGMARLRFTLPNGSVHESAVAEHKVRSSGVPLEGRLPVVFDRHSPDDVRAPAEGRDLAALLGVLAFGLLLLAFPAVSALKWLHGGPKPAAPSAPAQRPSSQIAEARGPRRTAQAVQQPTVQPARLAAVTRRSSVVGPARDVRGNVGAKA